MTIKLGNLVDWRVLEGKSLAFAMPAYDQGRPRRVRLDLNSEVGCNWYIRFQRLPIINMPEYLLGHEAKFGEPHVVERFLAYVPAGMETIEFTFSGDFEVMPAFPVVTEYVPDADGEVKPVEVERRGEVLYWNGEHETFWTEGDGETFSTIYERQPRNEALEYIQFQAFQNQARRDKAHAAELAEMRAAIGAINDGKAGIYGGAPAEHQEPVGGGNKPAAPSPKPAAKKAAKPAGDQSGGGADSQPDESED